MEWKNKSKEELIEEILHLEETLRHALQKADDLSGRISQESENKLRTSLDNTQLLALSIDLNGKIVYCNKALCQISGYKSEELVGSSIFEKLIHPEERKQAQERLHNFLSEGHFGSSNDGRMLTKTGRILQIKYTSYIMNKSGTLPTGLTLLAENITEKIKIAQELARSNKQLTELFDQAHDLIQISDPKGRLIFANRTWKEKLGFDPFEPLPDIKISDILHPDFQRKTLNTFRKIGKGEVVHNVETALLGQNGKSIYVTGNITRSFDPNGQVEIRAIFNDKSENIRAQKAQNLYNQISNLAIESKNLNELYTHIHNELKQVLEADNFFIALINEKENLITFPYYIDEHYKGGNHIFSRKKSKGLTEYTIRKKKPVFLYEEDVIQLAINQKIIISGPLPKIWLGVPLRLDNRIVGVIAVQTYKYRHIFTERDLDLLDFISGQVALAIERKQNEEKLNTQSARLKAIFENSSHLIWSVNRQLDVSSFNQNFADLLEAHYGLNPALSTWKKLPTKKRLEYEKFWLPLYEQGFMGQSQKLEAKFTAANGKDNWYELFLNPVYLEDGSIDQVSGIAHNITDKKKSDVALKISEEKFRNIFESFQDIYFRCNLDGTLTMASPSIKELLGYDSDKVLKKNITNYYLYNSRTKRLIRQLIKEHAVRNFEASVVRKDGQLINCICNVRLIFNAKKKPIAMEGVARDITSLKKVNEELIRAKELAEKSLKVKEQFLANMSHEIRTPMNGIIGMIELLGATGMNGEQEGYLQTIRKSSETLLNILNDILDLSKIEAGKMKLRKVSTHMASIFEKLYTMFLQQSLSNSINFHFFVEDRVPNYLLVDETRLLQILSNLTSNAFKFTDTGGSVTIRLKSIPKEESLYKVEVTDTGIGISEENQRKLFNNFSQLDNSTTKSFAGTGLGLVISKQLSSLMGGQIGVHSVPGEGSTFWFTFKAKEGNPLEAVRAEQSQAVGFSQILEAHQPSILLVDDNAVNRQVAGKILEKTGCRVTYADSGASAIQQVQIGRFDIIFMDIQMPDMDGIAATKAIRALNLPELPPIIAMTAYSMREDEDKFLSEGLDDYIAKPVKAQTMVNMISKWMGIQDTEEKDKLSTSSEDWAILNTQTASDILKFTDHDTMWSLYQDYLSEVNSLISEISTGIQKANPTQALNALHTLKGNSGTLGAEKLANQAQSMEAKLKIDKLDSVIADQEKLKEYFSEFKQNYRTLIENEVINEKSSYS